MKSSQVLFKNLAKILIQEWLYVFKEPVLVAASVRMNNHRAYLAQKQKSLCQELAACVMP